MTNALKHILGDGVQRAGRVRSLLIAMAAGLAFLCLPVRAESPLPVPDTHCTAIVHGRLLDGTGAAPVRNSVVLIRGSRIEAVGTTGSISIPTL